MPDIFGRNLVYKAPSVSNTHRSHRAHQFGQTRFGSYKRSHMKRLVILVLIGICAMFLIGTCWRLLATEIGNLKTDDRRGSLKTSSDGDKLHYSGKNPIVHQTLVHFTFNKTIMPDKFREHLLFLSNKIARKWNKKKWQIYDKVDISNCDVPIPSPGVISQLSDTRKGGNFVIGTPECAFWREIQPNELEDPDGKTNITKGGVTQGPLKEKSLASLSEEYRQRPFRKCCVEHQLLRDTAWYVIDLLEANHIDYFLSTGSALGAIRHNGTIIPWDTDVDIAVYPNDAQKVREIFSNTLNNENGGPPQLPPPHYFEKDPRGSNMYWVHASKEGIPANGPHVEIFYEKVYTSFLEELLPFEKCNFYGRIVNCPNRKIFGKWFPSGWEKYSSGHYEGTGKCVSHYKGVKKMVRHC